MSRKREHSEMEPVHISNEEILRIVEEITKDTALQEKEKARKYRRKYADFCDRHEALFDMACRPNFDVSKLKYMLSLRQQIENEKTTVEVASQKIGVALFNEYVKPIVDKTQPEK
jgi:hypothetical protein